LQFLSPGMSYWIIGTYYQLFFVLRFCPHLTIYCWKPQTTSRISNLGYATVRRRTRERNAGEKARSPCPAPKVISSPICVYSPQSMSYNFWLEQKRTSLSFLFHWILAKWRHTAAVDIPGFQLYRADGVPELCKTSYGGAVCFLRQTTFVQSFHFTGEILISWLDLLTSWIIFINCHPFYFTMSPPPLFWGSVIPPR
jgi:hypothetical protein